MTVPKAMALAANLKATPIAAETSSTKMMSRKEPLKAAHSPIQESLNMARKVNRK
ncbi:MAG: hypothetical protein WDA42_09015 [Candidatus Bathyarchaeia archaeon]|jgi:hypothetical protein